MELSFELLELLNLSNPIEISGKQLREPYLTKLASPNVVPKPEVTFALKPCSCLRANSVLLVTSLKKHRIESNQFLLKLNFEWGKFVVL